MDSLFTSFSLSVARIRGNLLFVLSIYAFFYTFLYWRGFRVSFITGLEKKCIKSCMLSAWGFQKCWRYPIPINLRIQNYPNKIIFGWKSNTYY
ncbi:hypothetical protein COO04_16310 [Bacillus toyonensis]|nr:hypothetical protein COO04_16310 [Bacillus toyonensis]PEK08216.1 hypothetical protein CN681_20730 [Bacillus toyonensis]PGA50169.1 hypothetical protein COL86_30310 [Bacillus toyonensis]PGB89059.1 hypothetical protein COM19_32145 [Bacillus toyonensis]